MKRSKLLLISGILSTAYLMYILSYFFGGIFSSSNEVEAVSMGLASILVMPHMLFVGLGVLFNWIGWSMRKRWAALVSGILYTVSIFFMIIYIPFVIIQVILCFIAFSKMKKLSTDEN